MEYLIAFCALVALVLAFIKHSGNIKAVQQNVENAKQLANLHDGVAAEPVYRFTCKIRRATEMSGHSGPFLNLGEGECLAFDDHVSLATPKELIQIKVDRIVDCIVSYPDVPYIMNLDAAAILANAAARKHAEEHIAIGLVVQTDISTYDLFRLERIQSTFNPEVFSGFINELIDDRED